MEPFGSFLCSPELVFPGHLSWLSDSGCYKTDLVLFGFGWLGGWVLLFGLLTLLFLMNRKGSKMLKVAEKYLAESNGSSDEFHKAWVV